MRLNHTIVRSRDPRASAAFLAGILGLPPATRSGRFLVIEADNEVFLDFAEADGEIAAQHYAFLADDDDFDAALRRIRARGVRYWADPGRTRPGAVSHRDGGRAVYFDDPDGHLLEILTEPCGDW